MTDYCPPGASPSAEQVLRMLLRSPLANVASVVVGKATDVAPNTTTQIASINGQPLQAQVWTVSIAPIAPDKGGADVTQVVRGANPWSTILLRWTVGNAVFQAAMDAQAGTTLQLAFDTLAVFVDYRPPDLWIDQDPNPVTWQVSCSTSLGTIPPALPTRTVSGAGNAGFGIPPFARSVTPLMPSTSLNYTLNFIDPLGAVIGSAYGIAGDQPPPTIDIPQGSSSVTLVGGPNIRWSLCFRLSF